MKKYCNDCGVTHTSIMCFKKPRRRIRSEATKTKNKRQQTTRDWFKANPPNEKGVWFCYLGIDKKCPNKLTRTTVRLEHVKSKARHQELKYDITNIKPACDYCNKLKGSLSADEAWEKYGRIR